ncbi:hypothetical protein Anapl_15157 [Anas platyrhynchos]|uniref:Uncharacterized protein n=1 Tax=Anas platyrhynchos TaxID=8839 RepID=R0LCB3_ANAPL|nr:hypothetical protein Anapl_15157 [Anas platyrhynchos]
MDVSSRSREQPPSELCCVAAARLLPALFLVQGCWSAACASHTPRVRLSHVASLESDVFSLNPKVPFNEYCARGSAARRGRGLLLWGLPRLVLHLVQGLDRKQNKMQRQFIGAICPPLTNCRPSQARTEGRNGTKLKVEAVWVLRTPPVEEGFRQLPLLLRFLA